ncbi:transporter substrate-binding domain-containing protein [Glycomyces terrestris]|uniref:Transporter substrate-binding domain-containing protein n=1 Tax=Glycomyces terrestris TaxID=2493553 RepID=A0A426UTF7_9ACTN|nr:transporter substrate-binding domain-containing protein [Glycomyces terrestris]RRR96825.1 transporter substrate-binding domain-containing protein [Glycomyces terrestris]
MRRTAPLLAAALALPLAAAGCTADDQSILDADVLRIAIQTDQPLIGWENEDGEYEGYDVDTARYIADHLGKEIEWVPVLTADRETVLLEDRADLTIASFSITQERKRDIDFAGPYAIAHQDLLVRAGDTEIASIADITGRRLCSTRGSNVSERINLEHGVSSVPVLAEDAIQCLEMLIDGRVDVIATDDRILAGLAWQSNGAARLVGAGYSEERLGIGMQPGDTAGCEAINRAITAMYADGTAELLMQQWFAPAGMDLSSIPIPQYEGCE